MHYLFFEIRNSFGIGDDHRQVGIEVGVDENSVEIGGGTGLGARNHLVHWSDTAGDSAI